jgi:hypothetical protein
MGRSLIIMGLILVAVGLVITFVPRIPWLGKLPRDIYIRKENFSFYFPVASSILISLVLSFVFWLFRR